MSDGLRTSLRILLTARADCLSASCSCPRARALVLVLSCSCLCSSARGRTLVFVVVPECSLVLVLPMKDDPNLTRFILRLFAFWFHLLL